MIRDYFVPAIQRAFPNQPFVFAEPPLPIASLRSPCVELGELQIDDDGDEATVTITEATHGHFGCYDESLSSAAKEQRISEDVVVFLSKLFDDRVVIWRLGRGRIAGGWKILNPSKSLPESCLIGEKLVWSHRIAIKDKKT